MSLAPTRVARAFRHVGGDENETYVDDPNETEARDSGVAVDVDPELGPYFHQK
jgi:hypothetical protein